MAKHYTWHRLADPCIGERDLTVMEVNGKKISFTRYEGTLYAFAYKCPHASGIMADGFVDDAGNVVCPLHRYRFNVKNGFNTSGEGYYLKTYPIEQREDGLYLGLEKTGLFGW
jgi:3-phenylpropionate/trans-cinnamate dioxygenase ferredoxin subunit